MVDWRYWPDPGRAIVSMQGKDCRTVLQGIITNDAMAIGPDGLLYAALLTPQGKYLFDFFLFEDDMGRILIDAHANTLDDLMRKIALYSLRRDVKIGREDGLAVGMLWPQGHCDAPPLPSPVSGAKIFADPRHEDMGFRVYQPVGQCHDPDAQEAFEQDYALRSILCGVPRSGLDLIPNETYILEAGFEHLGGVDFRKGCYVGQEVTARMKHKTQLRKGLARVTLRGQAVPGTQITANGQNVGVLGSVASDRALAHLRFDRAGRNMRAGSAYVDYVPDAAADFSPASKAANPSR